MHTLRTNICTYYAQTCAHITHKHVHILRTNICTYYAQTYAHTTHKHMHILRTNICTYYAQTYRNMCRCTNTYIIIPQCESHPRHGLIWASLNMFMYTNTRVHICICIHTCIYKCIYVHINTYADAECGVPSPAVSLYTPSSRTHSGICKYVYVYKFTCAHIYMHISLYLYMYAYIYIHI